MADVNIDLQEGFEGEDVVVLVDGREAARRSGVRTKRMLGLADSLCVKVPEGGGTVEVCVPARKLSQTVEVRAGETPYLGVSLEGGRLEIYSAAQPFGYA